MREKKQREGIPTSLPLLILGYKSGETPYKNPKEEAGSFWINSLLDSSTGDLSPKVETV